MAVQQNKKSPSRRNMRRSHHHLALAVLSVDRSSGELHRRHHLSANGSYRGKIYLASKDKAPAEE